mmetsp:Transcript_42436/g.111699  ORF Transcript_42436/g.111699 Transcript_42436/m.111699 type:complete len:202 (+) Transcript_42436:437-1042(+)
MGQRPVLVVALVVALVGGLTLGAPVLTIVTDAAEMVVVVRWPGRARGCGSLLVRGRRCGRREDEEEANWHDDAAGCPNREADPAARSVWEEQKVREAREDVGDDGGAGGADDGEHEPKVGDHHRDRSRRTHEERRDEHVERVVVERCVLAGEGLHNRSEGSARGVGLQRIAAGDDERDCHPRRGHDRVRLRVRHQDVLCHL